MRDLVNMSYNIAAKKFGVSMRDIERMPCNFCCDDPTTCEVMCDSKCVLVEVDSSLRDIEVTQEDIDKVLTEAGVEGVLEVDRKKDDITKTKVGQMFQDFHYALQGVSEITRYGIEKYQRPGSWKHAHRELVKYHDALGRHLLKHHSEMYDNESGYLHLLHGLWNILALVQMMMEFNGIKPRDITQITKPIEGITLKEPEWYKGGIK